MSQIKKLDNLIVKILKEELEETEKLAGVGAIPKLKNSVNYKKLNPQAQKDTEQELKSGGSVTLENEKGSEEQLESVPTGKDIAGQVAEIVDKLKAMSEGSEDPKKQKLAEKIMKQMESAKAALEALTAHEVMLEEKRKQGEIKDAEKHVKGFKKHLTKLVKEPAAVEKIAAKLTPEKMADLKKRVKSGELDEKKLASVMLNRALQEGWIK